jgi:DNA replication protein DnaC
MSADTQAVSDMLTRLHLTAIRDQLDSLLDDAAKRELSLREAVALLCERELSRRNERRITMATKIAHFPTLRDLNSFDFAAQPSLDKKQFRELAACRWVANGDALLLLGPPDLASWCPFLNHVRKQTYFACNRQTADDAGAAHPQLA